MADEPEPSTKGSRTTKRVAEDIYNQDVAARRVGKSLPSFETRLCNSACNSFCSERDKLLVELIKETPIHTNINEDLTDFKTASDMAEGFKCQCKCRSIFVESPKPTTEATEIL